MRQRLHYTPSQITNNLYTYGSEWALSDGTEYRGAYHRYSTGEVYTGPEWNEQLSKKLVEYVEQPTNTHIYKTLKNVRTKFVAPVAVIPNITAEQRNSGVITRYFIKKINENIFTEIDQKQYTDWTIDILDSNLYLAISIQWAISGNKQTTFNGAVQTHGVVEKNTIAIAQAELLMPGISLYLTNPLQFYTDTDFVVPKDINA
jgi:hypothetical protein